MEYTNFSQFKKLLKDFPVVPVAKILPLEFSPLEIFESIAEEDFSFFLDSARFHPRTGRFSFLGWKPFMIFKSKDKKIEIIRNGEREVLIDDPLDKLRELFREFNSCRVENLPKFTGGAVGFIGYDTGRLFEKLPDLAIDDLELPQIYLAFYDTVIAFDHLENKLFLITNFFSRQNYKKAYKEVTEKLESLTEKINVLRCRMDEGEEKLLREGMDLKIESNFTKERFEEMVRKAKVYIKKGDIYQANLSQRFCVETGIHPFLLYRVLREINPSPFAGYLNFPEVKIVSSSPERLLRVEGNLVETRPIAGTRPRGKDYWDNLRLRTELILNEKERAEHIMLVDLERNDLGRVCKYGTVMVDEFMVLEEYSHVIHIVSNIRGILGEGKDRFDLIRAAFPGGTITGCPKIRCMEIIEELEPVKRGIYCGSMGYFGFNGNMDLNIVIRTFIITQGKAYIQTGAGIVADSIPEREYFETLHKAEALLKAIKIAEKKFSKYKPVLCR